MPGFDVVADAFEQRFGRSFYYWNIENEIETLAAAMKQAGSSDPAKVAAAMSGMQRTTPLGTSDMRADNQANRTRLQNHRPHRGGRDPRANHLLV